MSDTAVPTRSFGLSLKEKDKVLPEKVPIVGLGCSSFSTFFWTKEETRRMQPNNENGINQFTAETLQRDHPKVQEWISAIHHAIIDCGITLLDTAPWYGHGTSEIVVGWALEDLLSQPNPKILREQLCINTKVGRYEADPKQQFDFTRQTTLLSVERSLRRFGGEKGSIGFIDVLQLHDPEFAPTLDVLMTETIPAMVECRSKGWCKALGLTGYPLEVQYQIFQQTLEKYGKDTATSVWDQALTYGHFNLHDSSLIHRPCSKGSVRFASFADFCRQQNIGLLAAAPLSMGLFTNNVLADWHPATSDIATACQNASKVCRDHEVDIVTLAMLYALSHPLVPCTIVGMKNSEQVDTAATVARRFRDIDWAQPGITQEDVLQQVLNTQEMQAYRILEDKENGPFADIWKESQDKVAKYQWDGIKIAHEFWEAMDGATYEDWQAKSLEA